MANAATQPSIAGFGSCPLDLWLARQCGARSSGELPGRLAIAQTALLRSTLRQAVRGAFYAARLRECKLDITSVGDLERLPFTTAEDLRNWGDFLCISQGDVQRMVTLHTSGTTGQPKRLAFTDADLARTRDFFAVGMSQLVGAGQRLAVLLPGAERPDGVADLLRQALGAAGVDVLAPPPEVHATPSPDADPCAEPGKALAQWLEQAKPHCLVAAPAQLALLLKHFPHRGPEGLAGILTSAEPLDDALGLALRRAWQCEILDHYGLTETAYGCAVECPAHQGFHVRELDVLIEIVDISGCKILAPGEEGEVVITTLQRQAMPLVRYRTGDVACLLPAPCACGSPLRRLGPVRGRIERKSGQPPRIVRPAKGRGV
ncbi:DVU_1553 family AMP-dependent CoA ligase [uncultured Desulfovibrio sp.]|uniref:DVU_1553 family AMP-dependent CoA ligase n=1 Tax=Desulfovibrio sp. TaxID=885 RepID=UPI00261C6CE6|nr:AMP-binding protein [uncultured Desulfovibrio sp.]